MVKTKKFFWGGEIPAEIMKRIRENPNIDYDKLIIKCKLCPPYKRQKVVEEYVDALIENGDIKLNEKGEVILCSDT